MGKCKCTCSNILPKGIEACGNVNYLNDEYTFIGFECYRNGGLIGTIKSISDREITIERAVNGVLHQITLYRS